MGCYVHLPSESKESFLQREGKAVQSSSEITWNSIPKGFMLVVLIDHRCFTTAGIAYCEREFDEIINVDDNRPRSMFLVEIKKLVEVSDHGFKRYVEQNNLI